MSNERTLALIQARIACALIEAQGMTAENQQRQIQGDSLAFIQEDFLILIEKYGIHHNAVISEFQEAY